MAVGAAQAQAALDVPSGQVVTFHDTIQGEHGPSGLTVRFRFLAPQIARDGGTMPAIMAQADMDFLCETYALPRLSAIGPQVSQVVITLMDRPVPFGSPVPEATQFFEAYRPENGRCIWEGF
ncbi:MAG: acetolactate synthase [Rhodobacteraceae bacterium]|nr:acetolactate synthase [Paracoccaceae bacterium]